MCTVTPHAGAAGLRTRGRRGGGCERRPPGTATRRDAARCQPRGLSLLIPWSGQTSFKPRPVRRERRSFVTHALDGSGARAPAGTGQPRQRPAALADGKIVLESGEIARALTRIAHEILERTDGAGDVVLLGIPTRGVPLAQRLGARLEQVEGRPVPAGSLDITMYRDDLRLRPARALGHTEVPTTGIDDKIVVLVDDVLYSGRTVRAALDALGDIGRPRAVQLAVLVDRGHRELPIRPDYVGKNLPTSKREAVRVLLTEVDGEDCVTLQGSQEAGR